MRAGIALVVALMTGVAGPATAFKLPDTDQRTCYPMVQPYFGQVPCAGTGQDGEHIGNPLSYTVNDDGTVTDDNTGLEWQQQDDGKTYDWFRSAASSASFNKPLAASVCSVLTLGGHTDWRLPTRKELMSIVDYSVPAPGASIEPRSFTDNHAGRIKQGEHSQLGGQIDGDARRDRQRNGILLGDVDGFHQQSSGIAAWTWSAATDLARESAAALRA